jgi:hypothetical protein
MPATETMTDTQAIDKIITLLNDTVTTLEKYDPLVNALPGVAMLVGEVAALKAARGL